MTLGTLLTLFVLPALYAALPERRARRREARRASMRPSAGASRQAVQHAMAHRRHVSIVRRQPARPERVRPARQRHPEPSRSLPELVRAGSGGTAAVDGGPVESDRLGARSVEARPASPTWQAEWRKTNIGPAGRRHRPRPRGAPRTPGPAQRATADPCLVSGPERRCVWRHSLDDVEPGTLPLALTTEPASQLQDRDRQSRRGPHAARRRSDDAPSIGRAPGGGAQPGPDRAEASARPLARRRLVP